MKNIKILILFTFVIHSFVCISQNNKISVYLGYPIPASAYTFKNNFKGIVTVGAEYSRKVFKDNLFISSNINYSFFQFKYDIPIDIAIIGIQELVSYDIPVSKFYLSPSIGIGYSWIKIKNKDIPNTYNEENINISSNCFITYPIKDKLHIGIGFSYPVIFEEYGEDNIELLYKEDKTIRYFSALCKINLIF